MFGRKTQVKKDIEEIKRAYVAPVEETPDLEIEEEVTEEIKEEIPEVKEEPKKVVKKNVPTEKPKEWMQITSGVLLDGGLHQYTIVSTYPIGTVGEIDYK